MSGGKVLSRIARRALHLDRKDDDGLQFYNFENVTSAKLFKDIYRARLDELPLSSKEIRKLVAEANVAFALNMRVFEELDVKGGVAGARVRNVREALAYYDIHEEKVLPRSRRRRRGCNQPMIPFCQPRDLLLAHLTTPGAEAGVHGLSFSFMIQ